jgi:hypothetical protein
MRKKVIFELSEDVYEFDAEGIDFMALESHTNSVVVKLVDTDGVFVFEGFGWACSELQRFMELDVPYGIFWLNKE